MQLHSLRPALAFRSSFGSAFTLEYYIPLAGLLFFLGCEFISSISDKSITCFFPMVALFLLCDKL